MAKRKRTKGTGSKLKAIKDYRNDEYIPYIYAAEAGIQAFWETYPALTDGDVREQLRVVIQAAEEQPAEEPVDLDQAAFDFEIEQELDHLKPYIVESLVGAFEEGGPLAGEDLVGVLKQINYSIGNMNTGMRQQGYLNFVKGFLADMHGEEPGYMDKVAERVLKYRNAL